jgi:molybdopterin-containing oxidoreductase family iron-sulfur binding subunit
MQASILDLYDPDRSQSVTHNGEISTWARFLGELNDLLKRQESNRGAGLRFLTETVSSPTLAAQLGDLLKRFPAAKWHQFQPLTRDNVREGSRLAFGQVLETQHRFDKAAVILSLDSDFLYTHPDRLRYTRQFADRRRILAGKNEMNRLYVVESSPSVTGTMAEHRLPMASGAIEQFAWQLVGHLGAASAAGKTTIEPADETRWLTAVVKDLQQHRGACVVIAGESQPASVHASFIG